MKENSRRSEGKEGVNQIAGKDSQQHSGPKPVNRLIPVVSAIGNQEVPSPGNHYAQQSQRNEGIAKEVRKLEQVPETP
jgi:hypothetical protein